MAAEHIKPYFDELINGSDEANADAAAGGASTTHHSAAAEPSGAAWTTTEDIPVASVSDDMSYGEAFAAARSQVGAGGMFEWRGNVYGTYYKDEWDNMTPAEKAEWGEQADVAEVLNHSDDTPDVQAASADAPAPEPAPAAEAAEAAEAAPAATDGAADASAQAAAVENDIPASGDLSGVSVESLNGDDVQVISIDTVEIDGMEMNVASLDIYGEPVMLVDADQDNLIDLGIADLNHDGVISENELIDFSDSGLSMFDGSSDMSGMDMDMGTDTGMDPGIMTT